MEEDKRNKPTPVNLHDLKKALEKGEKDESVLQYIDRIQQISQQANKLDGKTTEEIQEKIDKRIEESGGKKDNLTEDEIKMVDETIEMVDEKIEEENEMLALRAKLENKEREFAIMKIEINKKKEEIIELRKEYDKKYGIDS